MIAQYLQFNQRLSYILTSHTAFSLTLYRCAEATTIGSEGIVSELTNINQISSAASYLTKTHCDVIYRGYMN